MVDGKNVSMQLWDTAGGEKHLSFQTIFYRHADACVLAFDLTDMESFQAIQGWKDELLAKAETSNPTTFPFILIGNKEDLIEKRVVILTCKRIRFLEFRLKNGAKTMEICLTMKLLLKQP